MSTKHTSMHLIEDGDLECFWECNECGAQFEATTAFENSTHCPKCGRHISKWYDFGEEGDQ